MIMIISDPEKIDRKLWSAFVFEHPNGNIFQTPKIYQVYNNTKNYKPIFLAALESGKVVGILVSVIQKEYSNMFGLLTARAIMFGGPLVSGDDPNIMQQLLIEYHKQVSGKVIYSQIRNFHIPSKNEDTTILASNFKFIDHLNILVDLSIGVDDLWRGIKRNRKDGINKAKKNNFYFKVYVKLKDISIFYQLLIDLYSKIKLPYPDISFFNYLNNELSDDIRWFTLEQNGKQLIILCALISKNTLHAFTIGISQDKDFHNLRPVDLFYWEVIKWASENGFKNFDWMGAGKPDEDYGVRKFKLQYGGEPCNFGRYLYVHNKVMYKFGKWGLRLKKTIKK